MKSKRGPVIITGGSGYVGSAVIKAMKDTYHIISLDNNPPPHYEEGVDYRRLNLAREDDIENVLEHIRREWGEYIFSVIHLAGYYNFNGEKNPLYNEINVKGTRNFLSSLQRKFDVGQFVFASSMLIYSPTKTGEKITEDSLLNPGWAYPESKIQGEEIIRTYHGRIPFVILRIAAVYNDFGYAPSIAQQILRISELQFTSFMFPGDPRHRQSTIHVDDLAIVIGKVVDNRDKLPHETFMNVAEEETITYKEIQEETSRLIHNKTFTLHIIPKLFAKTGAWILSSLPGTRSSFIRPWMIEFSDANFDMDNSKVKSLLNWKPTRNLGETLPSIVTNLQLYPGTWYQINKIPMPPLPSLMRTKILKQVLT